MDQSVYKSPVEGCSNQLNPGVRYISQNNRPMVVIHSSQIKSGQKFLKKPSLGLGEFNNSKGRTDDMMNINQLPVIFGTMQKL